MGKGGREGQCASRTRGGGVVKVRIVYQTSAVSLDETQNGHFNSFHAAILYEMLKKTLNTIHIIVVVVYIATCKIGSIYLNCYCADIWQTCIQ